MDDTGNLTNKLTFNDSLKRILKNSSLNINEKVLDLAKYQTRDSNRAKILKTENIAKKLVDIYRTPTSYKFFLKAAWHLSEDFIFTAVEKSQRKGIRYPVKYFVRCCSEEMKKS